MSKTLTRIADDLRDALVRYVEATYHIRDEGLNKQRRKLLEAPGVLRQVPFVEVLPQYRREGALSDVLPEGAREVLAALSVPGRDDLGTPLPSRVFPPYRHQLEAISYALGSHARRPGTPRSVVVTTGTGSGKTECFLIPILARLSAEAFASRQGRAGSWQTPAVRVLVLYPMNALVNDQLGRLRQWLGDPRVVDVLHKKWGVRPIRFSRYTSRTPYPGVRRLIAGRDEHGQPLKTASGRVRFYGRDGSNLAPKSPGQAKGTVKTLESFFVEHERLARQGYHAETQGQDPTAEQRKKLRLVRDLRRLGKWPVKPDLEAWLLGPNRKGGRWFRTGPALDGSQDEPLRAVCGPRDAELITRHEVQREPPDVLITNYSMLEYMLMRPIERGIFEQTRAWLRDHPHERLLLVIDEAHLYRGTAGAEVALLLRRLTERLGLGPERLQVILTSASFSEDQAARRFAAELTGKRPSDFEVARGVVVGADRRAQVTRADLEALCAVERARFEDLRQPTAQRASAVASVVQARLQVLQPEGRSAWQDCEAGSGNLEAVLWQVLDGWGPLERLRAVAMPGQHRPDDDPIGPGARPVREVPAGHSYEGHTLDALVFEDLGSSDERELALTNLLALASAARRGEEALLPSRAHLFFRGLPGLWACIDPACTEVPKEDRSDVCGKLYAHDPGSVCACGARVFPLFTCRDCGSAFLRGYMDVADEDYGRDGAVALVDAGGYLWSEPGFSLEVGGDEDSSMRMRAGLAPVDLFLPRDPAALRRALAHDAYPGLLHLRTGRVVGEASLEDGGGGLPRPRAAPGCRLVVLPPPRPHREDEKPPATRPGQARPCPCCGGEGGFGRSTVMDHVTKGQQPLAALVGAQLAVQRGRKPSPDEALEARDERLRFAPLEGRKVLIFSDSRQKAAGLSIDVNTFAATDAVRPVLVRGWRALQALQGDDPDDELTLEHALDALLVGEVLLNAQLRTPTLPAEADAEKGLGEKRGQWTKLLQATPLNLKKAWKLLGTCPPPPASLRAVLYGALAGTTLRIDPSGTARPRPASLRQLNRTMNLSSIAVAHLAAHASRAGEAKAAVPGWPCPHDTSGCAACRLRAVDTWLSLVAAAYGIECSLVTQDWRTDEVIRPLPAAAKGSASVAEVLRNALGGDEGRARELHAALRPVFTEADHLQARHLTLRMPELTSPGDCWVVCEVCTTVQLRLPYIWAACAQCGARELQLLRLELDGSGRLVHGDEGAWERWFANRKGLQRDPIVAAVLRDQRPLVPVAAEHTAQVGDAPRGEIFSPAELHELLFQDIEVGVDHRGRVRPAVDVLSCTTTMEVGIDIGSLAGVALRNMPPRRDNYQQRAGRAGRRGDGVATVLGYANTGTHDTRAFERPQTLLSDPVDDPRLALDNALVAQRHANAALLQQYAHGALGTLKEWEQPQLFAVLGTVSSFLQPTSPVSLQGFEDWLARQPPAELSRRLTTWAAAGLTDSAKRDFEAHVLERARKQVTEAVRAAELRREGTMSGHHLAEEVLDRTGWRLRPLLDFLKTQGGEEHDWLELKACVVPSSLEPGVSKAQYRWHVARAVLALHNSWGGAVLIGVTDDGRPVDDSELEDLDGWRLKTLSSLLGSQLSWERQKGPRAERVVPDRALHEGLVVLRPAWLDGHPVAVLLVPRAPDPDAWLTVRRGDDAQRWLPVRGPGVGGQVTEHEADSDVVAGLRRQATHLPPRFSRLYTTFCRWWEAHKHAYAESAEDSGEDNEEALGEEETSTVASAEEPKSAHAGSGDEFEGLDGVGPDALAGTSPHRTELGQRSQDDPELLRVLIDAGVLPSYAFPTAVVAFHVLDPTHKGPRHRYFYAPSLGLEQALSQYAPGRALKVDNQVFHVGALYDGSPGQRARHAAYQARQAYFHCGQCNLLTSELEGRALTVADLKADQVTGNERTCPVCGHQEPLRAWLEPTGFSHVDPAHDVEVLEPLSYATSARLVVPSPGEHEPVRRAVLAEGRLKVVSHWRGSLLVLNEGARRGGYAYCTSCGRIEPAKNQTPAAWRSGQHDYPYPVPVSGPEKCDGRWVTRSNLTLGHQFETDVCLLQLDLAASGLSADPADATTRAALQSFCEGLGIAASERALAVQPGELGVGFRWPPGAPQEAIGASVEIYLFDRVPGGAGYASDAAGALGIIFHELRDLLSSCECATSCYRCLRRYTNQLHHGQLDRHLALFLLDSLEKGGPPDSWQPRSHVALCRVVAEDVAAKLEGLGARVLPADRDGLTEVPGVPGALASAVVEVGSRYGVLALQRPLVPQLEAAQAGLRAAFDDVERCVLTPSLRALYDLPGLSRELLQRLEDA